MASISLPRVLTQRRGGPVEVERENFWKAQTASIGKAINNQENPVKEKHVRSAIIGTYHEKGSTTFWAVVGQLPVQGNPIVCWKFCHTLHKLLREGHSNVIPESQAYRHRLLELGKYWGHLRDTFGKLISCYCRLLSTKLEFHARNPKFPGNMALNDEQLESIGEMDINNFFQITVEMFDYMDDILALQSAVFGSLETGRANSMTSSGQCRLAPLIPCIQDSSHLYDYLVKLLFKLHSSLSPDVLVGHRDRFYKQFKVLRDFYRNGSILQYFKHLIQIPLLPEEAPNFLVKSDLSSHVSPVVILPPQDDTADSDSVVDDLVDTNSSNLLDIEPPTNGSISPDILLEKDQIIERLMRQIEELQLEIVRIKAEDQKTIDELRRRLMSVDTYMKELQEQLMSRNTEIQVLQASAAENTKNTEAVTKLEESEKKAKAQEEKFIKMKDVYTKLREEHIVLLRAKGEVDKQLSSAKQSSSDIEKTKTDLEKQLHEAISARINAELILHEAVEESAELIKSVQNENKAIQQCKIDLEKQFTDVAIEKESIEQRLRQLEGDLKLQTMAKENLECQVLVLEEQLRGLEDDKNQLKNEMLQLEQASAFELTEMRREKTELIGKVDELWAELVNAKRTLEENCQKMSNLQLEKTELEESLRVAQTSHEDSERNRSRLLEQLSKCNEENAMLQRRTVELEERVRQLCTEKSELEQTLDTTSQDLAALKDENHKLQMDKEELEMMLFKALDEKHVTEAVLSEGTIKLEKQLADLNRAYQDLQSKNRDMEEQLAAISKDKTTMDQTVADLRAQLSTLEASVLNAQKESEENQEKMTRQASERQRAFLVGCIEEAENIVQAALDEIDNPATAPLTCPPEYLRSLASPLSDMLERLGQKHVQFSTNGEELEALLKLVTGFAHFLGQFIVHGRATANASPDIEQGDKLISAFRVSGKDVLKMLANMKNAGTAADVKSDVKTVQADIQVISGITDNLIAESAAKAQDKLDDLVEMELAEMDRAIEEAASRIADILSKSRKADTGIKLEVSEKILDACTALMESIKVLVKQAKELQTEIVAQGKGSASEKEFYKRNSRWTEGLISAAKAVGIGAKFMVDAADKVVSGQAKFEVLVAASQEIAASTAQLVVASKVKASPSSENLRHLSKASTGVRGCTGNVVATVKDCAQMMDDNDVMDFAGLTLHQAKRLEMESQVRVLELENNLEKERFKLATLRKRHYSLAGAVEGWEENTRGLRRN